MKYLLALALSARFVSGAEQLRRGDDSGGWTTPDIGYSRTPQPEPAPSFGSSTTTCPVSYVTKVTGTSCPFQTRSQFRRCLQ